MAASPTRIYLAGAPCDLVTQEEFLALATQPRSTPLLVSSFNLAHVGTFGIDGSKEGFFADSEASGRHWLVTLDGVPPTKAASRVSGRAWPKLSGSDMLLPTLEHCRAEGLHVGNFGASVEANHALAEYAATHLPGLKVTTWAPSPADLAERSPELARQIREAKVDVLVVSLPKPLSEQWCHDYGDATGARSLMNFGAAVDFLVGTQVRAPARFQKLGLEWFWRLSHQPRRLFRRYVIEGPGEVTRLLRFSSRTPHAATPELWRQRIGRRLLALDALVVATASIAAAIGRQALEAIGLRSYAPSIPTLLLAIPVLIVAIGMAGGRSAQGVRVDGRLYQGLLSGVVSGAAALGLISFLFKLNTARGYIALLTVTVVIGGLLARWACARSLERARRRGRNLVRLVAVGHGRALSELLAWFETHPSCGYKVVGRFSSIEDIANPTTVGVLAVDGSSPSMTRDADELIRGSGEVMVVPDLTSIDAHRLQPDTYADVSVLHVTPIELNGPAALVKRTLDVSVALLTLLVLALPLAVAAWRVKREDGGPVLFRQVRVGLDGEEFEVLKLRTMHVDAEDRLADLRDQNEAGPYLFKMSDDPRVTKIGKRLRAWSIDELPQLLNVIRGDMSLVGPRPALPSEVALFPKEAHRRHRVRPGLTGLWQVSGRSNLDSSQALALDVHYVANWSLGTDLSILLRNFRAVITREGSR